MMFDASTLISDSRLAFMQGQYEVSLTLAKEVFLIPLPRSEQAKYTRLGDSNINSSIGSQWKSHVGTPDSYINEKAATLPGSTKLRELDIEFVLK